MMKFKCKYCDHEFESTEHRPMCPQGCKLDRMETSRPDDFSTAVRDRTDGPAKPAKPAKRKTKRKSAKKPAVKEPLAKDLREKPPAPPNDGLEEHSVAGLREFAEAGDIKLDANETKAGLVAANAKPTPPKPSEVPENEPPESPSEPESPKDEADSLDNGENP